MKGSRTTILENARKAKTVQVRSSINNAIVTFKADNPNKVVVFTTTFHDEQYPIKNYFNVEDVEKVISHDELLICCQRILDQTGWKFIFQM